MAKKWVEVAASPAYQALAPEQQEEARNQYWNEVVAPNVPQAEHAQVRQAFDSDTSRTVNWPGQAPLEAEIVGGTRQSATQQAAPAQQQPQTAPDGWEYGPLRDTMFGARSVLQGAGGLLGAIGGDAFNNYIVNPVARAVGAQEARPYREEAGALADSLGLPKAQTAGDRVLGDVGEALTGTGLTLGAGAGLNALANMGRGAAIRTAGYVAPVENRLANFLTAQPGLQTVSAATGSGASSISRESGGSQGNQLLAGLAGGLGPGLVTAGGAAGLRGVVRGGSGENMKNRLADFNALGAQPSVGQASGNPMVQGLENLLAQGPTSSGVMARAAERQSGEISSGLGKMANEFSRSASGERAGRAIKRGIYDEGGFSSQFKATQDQLYDKVDELIPPPKAWQWATPAPPWTPSVIRSSLLGHRILPDCSRTGALPELGMLLRRIWRFPPPSSCRWMRRSPRSISSMHRAIPPLRMLGGSQPLPTTRLMLRSGTFPWLDSPDSPAGMHLPRQTLLRASRQLLKLPGSHETVFRRLQRSRRPLAT